MSKISEKRALEAYPMIVSEQTISCRLSYSEGYDKAMQDIFNYLEANIPCGEMSSEDVRDFIIECKEYFK